MATEGTRFCDWLTRQPELLHRQLDLERDERDAFGVAKTSPVQEVEIMPTYKTPTGSTQ
jgi:hypothetical protein